MKVLVDTPIWSFAFRSKNAVFAHHVEHLKALIADQRVVIIGAIRQEVLSGYSDFEKFETLKNQLQYFENALIIDEDYVQAAEFYNLCRKKGMQGSHVDFLICAVAVRLGVEIYTTDKDFLNYQQYLPIKLYRGVTQ